MCERLLSFVAVRWWVDIEWLVRWEKSFGRTRAARGRREESEAHIIAVPTSITHQLREDTVLSVEG